MLIGLLLLWVVKASQDCWFNVDDKLNLSFDSPEVQDAFDGNSVCRQQSWIDNVLLEKSPVYEVVRMRFVFQTDSKLALVLQDAFCAGQSYCVRDNGVYLAKNFPDLPTLCGVSTTNLAIIYSPEFMQAEFFLTEGSHDLVLTIIGSRIGSKVTSMRVTLEPFGGIVGSTVNFKSIKKDVFSVPPGTDINSI